MQSQIFHLMKETILFRFAGGVERIYSILPPNLIPGEPRPVCVVAVYTEKDEVEILQQAVKLATQLRKNGIHVLQFFSPRTKTQISKASKSNSIATIFIGEDEIAKQQVTVKLMDMSKQISIPWDKISLMNQEDFVNLEKSSSLEK